MKTVCRGETEYEGGATYLWLMPLGQYEIEQMR